MDTPAIRLLLIEDKLGDVELIARLLSHARAECADRPPYDDPVTAYPQHTSGPLVPRHHHALGNGLGVCEMLASDPDRCGVPVIISTGPCDEDVVRRGHSLCAYCNPKCENLWPRVEPLIRDLLGDAEPAANQT